MTKNDQIYLLLTKIPRGKVTTYGALGKKTGINPRHVGRILHENPNAPIVPCHRVVKSDRRLATGYGLGGPSEQKRRLVEEGVIFEKDRVKASCMI